MTGLGLVVGVWDLRFIRFLQRGGCLGFVVYPISAKGGGGVWDLRFIQFLQRGVLGVSGFPGSRHSTFTPVVSWVFF